MATAKSAGKKGEQPKGTRKVRVVATKLGWDGLKRRRSGEKFTLDVRDGQPLPSWVVTVEEWKEVERERLEAEDRVDDDNEETADPSAKLGSSSSVL